MNRKQSINYLPDLSLSSYLNKIKESFPDYFSVLMFDNKKIAKIIRDMDKNSIDFEEGSTQAKWFNDVVDQYSLTDHKYQHLTKRQIQIYLRKSGFRNIRIIYMYDPFIVSDTTGVRAYEKLISYTINMYCLEKLKNNNKITKQSYDKVCSLIKEYIIYDNSSIKEAQPNWKKTLSFYRSGNHFFAEMPRLAIVGIGTK